MNVPAEFLLVVLGFIWRLFAVNTDLASAQVGPRYTQRRTRCPDSLCAMAIDGRVAFPRVLGSLHFRRGVLSDAQYHVVH